MRARLSAALLALCGVGLAIPPAAVGRDCAGIAPETAQRLFERLKQVRVDADYRFDGLGTTQDELRVLWSHGEAPCPPIQVVVDNCDSMFGLARLALRVPPELTTQCPGLAPVLQALRDGVAGERPIGHGAPLAPAARPALAAVTALVLAVGLAIRHLIGTRRRRGDLAWIALALATAALFAVHPVFAATLGLGLAWPLLAVLLVDGVRRSAIRAHRLALLGLFLFALLLHWAASSGGPGDLHLNLGLIWSSELELRWGPAPIAFFRLLALLPGGLHDTGIIWCNLVLSALVPLLLYAVLRELGIGHGAGLGAAAVVAAHPLLIVFSGVLERQPLYLLATLGGLLGLTGFLRRGSGRQFVAFAVGAGLAITTRPEGAQMLILPLAVLLGIAAPWRARAAAALGVALLLLLAFGYVRHVLPNVGSSPYSGALPFLWNVLLNPEFTPIAWIAAWLAGLLLGLRQPAAWVGWASLIGLDLTWRATGMYRMFAGHERQVASSRYETILLVPFAIGVALLIQIILRGGPRLRLAAFAALALLTLATARQPVETLLRPFTIDYEYRFLRRQALALPADARLYVLDPPLDDAGFIDAHLVGDFVASPVDFRLWSERNCADLAAGGPPTFLYLGSACAELLDNVPRVPLPPSYPAWLRDCAAIRSRLGAQAVEEAEVPARKLSWHDFKDPTVRIGLYRLTDASICDIGPTAATRPRSG
jgi:hypothetical protein